MYDDDDENVRPAEPTPKPQRSRADEIIEAVSGVVQEQRAVCEKCGSARLRKVRPLGTGSITVRCLDCKSSIAVASVSGAKIAPPIPQGVGGGYYRAEPLPAPSGPRPKFKE